MHENCNYFLQIILYPLIEEGSSGEKCRNPDNTEQASSGCCSYDDAVSIRINAGHGATGVTLKKRL